MAVRLLYGDDAQGRLVHVSQAARGRACGLFCPACRTPLVAKKGEVRVAHLAHDLIDRHCVGAVETVTHRLAKEVFLERRTLLLPGFTMSAPRPRGRTGTWDALYPTTIQFDTVEVEAQLAGVRPDAVAGWARGQIAVEFLVTHATTSEKVGRLRALGLAAIEIDLGRFVRWDIEKEAIACAVVSDAPREWLTAPIPFAPELVTRYQTWFEEWERRERAWELEDDLATLTARRGRQPSAMDAVSSGFAALRAAHGIPEPQAPNSTGVRFDMPSLRTWLHDEMTKRRPRG